MLDWNNTLGVVKQTKSKYPKEEIEKEIGGHCQCQALAVTAL